MSDIQQRRVLDDHGQQLVQAIDGHELDAGLLKDLLAGQAAEGFSEDAISAAVAVVVGIGQQSAISIQKGEIHAPGVQPHAGQVGRVLMGHQAQTLLDLAP